MTVFTSPHERRLWLGAGLAVAALYATIGLAGSLASFLDPIWQNIASAAFAVLFFAALLFGIWTRLRPVPIVIAWIAGVAVVYLMLMVRLAVSPLERTHLFEYGVVALFIHAALMERRRNGYLTRQPALIAIALASMAGVIDEALQALIPTRIFDLRDMGFNIFAVILAITANIGLTWAINRSES